MRLLPSSATILAPVLLLLPLAACSGGSPPPDLVLLSIDTLRADHLGAYGYERDTSPFFDELAASGTLFERAFAQIPGTLPSHMSMFTGLYPAQHDVYPPDDVLSTEIPTLPELLRRRGYRTGGFTEGGYVAGSFGFARGFDEFDDRVERGPRTFEATLAKGFAFLDGLDGDEPFFLFLHTYAVHDPYDPPEEYRDLFWQGQVPDTFEPTGPNLVAVNRGRRSVSAEAVRYYEALYDAGIRYVDDQLGKLWQRLGEGGFERPVILVVTADHGEEFLEHGHLVHEQNYVETTHVPLLVTTVGRSAGARVASLVESVDLAPSLLALAGVEHGGEGMEGASWTGLLDGRGAALRDFAYSESFVHPVRALVRRDEEDGALLHLMEERIPAVAEGEWIGRRARLDTLEEVVEIEAESYRVPRALTVEDGGETVRVLELEPGAWTAARLELGPGLHRLRLSVPDCEVPEELGLGGDRRCLGFRLKGPDLVSWELFDLGADPREQDDLAGERRDDVRRLARELGRLHWKPLALSMEQMLTSDEEEDLKALGYLQ